MKPTEGISEQNFDPILIMTKSKYGACRNDFKTYFKLQSGAGYKAIQSTRKVIFFTHLMKLIPDSDPHKEPDVMRLTYGLDGSQFVLMLELLELASGVFVSIPGSLVCCMDFNNRGAPSPITLEQKQAYSDAYIANVWYVNGEAVRHLSNGGNTPDPTSVWFDWDLKVVRLLDESHLVEDRWLVLDCMSSNYDYSQEGYPVAPMHGIGLNVAMVEGGVLTDHLDDNDYSSIDKGDSYYKAMDLGNLHPPKKP